MNYMNNAEIIEMLETIKEQAQAVRFDDKSAVLIEDTKLSSFAWVISEAIQALKEGADNE